jgi:hypothetical protein
MPIVRLTTTLDDVDGTLALYDRIQYWRSTTGSSGTYSEITSQSGGPAILIGTAQAPFTLLGLSLNISLSGADPFTVTFPGPDPTNAETVAVLINAASPSGIATLYSGDTRKLQLTNPTDGTQSTIQVSGSAASVLGLSTSEVSGTAPRTLMGNLNDVYKFADYNGDPAFFYKTRFYNSLTGAVSNFSAPQAGGPTQVLPDASLVTCSVNLAMITGAPIIGRRIILVASSLQQVPNGGVNFGLLPSGDRIELTTDESGHAQTQLAVGTTIRAFFEGSGYAREFVVPDANFDLLTVLSTQPDPFTIVQAPPMPIREG